MKDLSDLEPNQILRSLDDLVETGDYQDTEYGVWYHGRHISPARVITRAYELLGRPIDRQEITTITAQKRLLELDFPIVERSLQGFFTKTELSSFSKIVARQLYDPNNRIDRNIADFLNQVPWGKTKRWAHRLAEKGWIIKGRKNWNKRHGKEQGIKDYTWFRVYPKERLNDLICFTVGIHGDGGLVYKLHNMFSDEAFKGEKGQLFNEMYYERGLDHWPTIPLNEIGNYDWDSLVEESHQFFNDNLTNFKELSSIVFDIYDRRIMRLTWNNNQWEKPSGHRWRKEDQGRTDKAYENQYGYGHEEWLFNHRYKKNGFHYGYVRGVDSMSATAETIDELVLFAINPKDKGRYLIAKIKHVTIVEGTDEIDSIVKPLIEKYMTEILEELDDVNADVASFKAGHLIPNIKFKWEDVTVLNDPVPAPYLNGPEFNRFQAYKIEGQLIDQLDSEIAELFDLKFNSGKASTSATYEKKTQGKTTQVERSHSKITNDLYDYLHETKGIGKAHLSAEKTRIGGAIVDFALKDQTGDLTLFEAKTSSSGLSNIRQALGQLFEYAFLDESARIKELIIVGPAELKEHELGYLNRIRSMLNVPLNYWAYHGEAKLEEKFSKS